MVKHKYGGRLLAASLLTLALPVLAACGNGSPAAAPVAALGNSASATASPKSTQSAYQQGLKYSACMRSHGIKAFPDPVAGPNGGVGFQISRNSGIDPNSSQMKAAQAACESQLPGGKDGGAGSFNPAKIAPWAACIRQHGIKNFPDPTNTGTGIKIDLSGTGIDPNNLQTAMQACDDLNPGGMVQLTGGGNDPGSPGAGG